MSTAASVKELAALVEEIENRERGRIALIRALVEIAESETHREAVERAKLQLRAAGVYHE